MIVDVEATTSVRQAEVTAQRRMIERTQHRFGIWPERLVADAAYGSAPNLAWLVEEMSIEPNMPARKVTRSIHEGARGMVRDIATSDAYLVSRRQRKKVEMLFAHLKRILKLDRLRLRGPNGARDEFHLAAAAQNLRKMAKIIPMARPTLT